MKLNTFAIKSCMAHKGLTVADLARLAGMAQQNLSKILTRGTCSIPNVGKLANALEVDISEIAKEG